MAGDLDQAGSEAAEEVLGFGFGLGYDLGLVVVFEFHFLKKEFDGVFGLEAVGDQFADAGSKALVDGGEARVVVGTVMIAKLGRCQAVEGSLGLGIVE